MPLWQPTTAVARPAYFDRDPIPVNPSFYGIIPPHGFTTQATYTPAFGYAAFIEEMVLTVVRTNVAAPAGVVNDWIIFLPFFGGYMYPVFLYDVLATAFDSRQLNVSSFGYMAYGDTLAINTSDVSTGGFMLHNLAVKGTEFLY